MKNFLTVTVFLFVFSFCAQSQKAATSVYAELGGPGLASFNFDTRFAKKEDGIGGRVGIGGFSIEGEGAVFIPVGVNYLLGRDKKNYFELGAGVTPVFGTGDIGGDFSATFGHLLFGYRLQPEKGGFMFKAFISPVFGNGFFVPYYGGVSFGYKF